METYDELDPLILDIDQDVPQSFSEMNGGEKFAYWSYVVSAILCAVTFVCLLYITIRVI